MLHNNTSVRLAFQHSPAKEQRLLFVDNAKNEAENPESFGGGQKETQDPIESQTAETREALFAAAPEALIVPLLPEKGRLFDTIQNNGSLDEEIQQIAKEKKIDLSRCSEESKAEIVENLLKNPTNALCIARILKSRKERYEDYMRLIPMLLKKLQDVGAKGIDNAKQLASIFDLFDDPEYATPENREEKILEGLGITPAIKDQKDIQEIFALITDIVKTNFKREGFSEYTIIDKPEELEKRMARDKELQLIEEQRQKTEKYFDALLQAEAKIVEKNYKDFLLKFEGKTNENILGETGVSAEGLFIKCAENMQVCRSITRKNDVEPHLNLPKPDQEEFLDRAEAAWNNLQKSKEALEINEKTGQVHLIVEKKIEEEENERRAKNIADRMATLGTSVDAIGAKEIAELCAPFAEGNIPSEEERTCVRIVPSAKLKEYENILRMLDANPELWKKTQEMNVKKADLQNKNTPEEQKMLREQLENIEQNLPNLLTHQVCVAVQANTHIGSRLRDIRATLFNTDKEVLLPLKDEEFAHITLELRELQKCMELLDSLYNDSSIIVRVATKEEFKKYDAEAPDTTKGIYDYSTKKIVINESACRDENEVQATIEHERGHAILDIISRRTNIAPNLFANLQEKLQEKAIKKGITFDDLLQKAKETWGCPSATNNDYLLDELVTQFADYQGGNLQHPSDAEKDLFKLLEEKQEEEPSSSDQDTKLQPKVARSARASASDEEVIASGVTTDADVDTPNPRAKLQELKENIDRIDAFFVAYPERANDQGVPELRKVILDKYIEAKRSFENNKNEAVVAQKISEGEDNVQELLDAIKEYDTNKMDLANAETSKQSSWHKALFDGVAWMSLSDFSTLFKDASEDIQRMWKRRSEGARSSVGKALFQLIPERIPYIGQLQREFQGREKSSEEEEVGVWEKRYDKIDSHVLLHDILPHLIKKDQIKAVVNLLTKRGRMDWNFTPFWNVLEKLSIWHMPHKPCKRDQQLRNAYLQKLSANIWDDKDLFEHWKNENDSQIGSQKSQLNPTIDELASTQGASAAKLKELLEKQRLLKQHFALPKEEEVNPHLYEGILHYSMKNGKMAMEDKVFYLIQGVAHDMISIDRVKAFVGEQGDLLGVFPIIDFFNNRTDAEIREMAKRIGYPDAVSFDIRTTDFLLDEIRNNENARSRVSKALKQAQNFDHEDLPLFVSMIDHRGMSDLISPVSGTSPKVSKDGMKNIYVGYNSAFQYFAIRAKLHKDYGTPFTDAEATQCATMLTAYVNFDNRVTIQADANKRPTLSWNNINNEKTVSGGSALTKEFRNRMNIFTKELATKVGITSVGAIPLDQFICIGRENREENYENLEKVNDVFNKSLVMAFIKDKKKNVLIDFLADMATNGGFMPENSKYTYENMKNQILAQQNSAPHTTNHPVLPNPPLLAV